MTARRKGGAPPIGPWRAGLETWIAAALAGVTLFFPAPRARAQTTPGSATGVRPVAQPAASSQRHQAWPTFRGPAGNAHAEQANPPTTWSVKDDQNVRWKTPITRHGMSSPVVSEDHLFVTAADDVYRQVLCLDVGTGGLLWEYDLDSIPGSPKKVLPNVLEEAGYASPTPVTDGRLVGAVFATGELVCVDVAGKLVWAKDLGAPRNHYGHTSSLISSGTSLIVQYDQKEDPKLMAFDFASGRPAWQAKRHAIAWSSPILVDNQGRSELVLTDSKGVEGFDPKTGTSYWRVDCLSGEVASSAAYADGVVFVASEGSAATAIAINPGETGPKILWQWTDALPDAASPLATKEFVILPTSFGVVTCLDAKTGKVHWQHEFDTGFNSSPVLANGRVYLVDLSGVTQVFELGTEFKQVGKGVLGEGVYATPAIVGGRVFIRGLRHVFCIGASN